MKVHCVFVLFFSLYLSLTSAYRCENPENWKVSGNSKESLWPGGIVKYRIHPSLTVQDRLELFAAFEEYQNKTFIRFQQARNEDADYVTIKIDDSVCGQAQLCRRGGEQFAIFGSDCRKTNSMVHQLGHVLCLGHVKCNEQTDIPGFYDIASQMYSSSEQCGNTYAFGCGQNISKGLSLLDADYINQLYNSQGCFRHRWIPINKLTESHNGQLFNFGHTDRDGKKLFPCRGFSSGELTIGKYRDSEGACWISQNGKEYKLADLFEVLTIPGGLADGTSQYKLIQLSENMTTAEKIDALKTGIVAGKLPWADGTGLGNGYVMFAKLDETNNPFEKSMESKLNPDLATASVIGTVWFISTENSSDSIVARGGFNFLEYQFTDYQVLTCRMISGAVISNGDICNQNTPHLQYWPNTMNILSWVLESFQLQQKLQKIPYTKEKVQKLKVVVGDILDKLPDFLKSFSQNSTVLEPGKKFPQITGSNLVNSLDTVVGPSCVSTVASALYTKLGPVLAQVLDNEMYITPHNIGIQGATQKLLFETFNFIRNELENQLSSL